MVAVLEDGDDAAARVVESAAPDADVQSIPVLDVDDVATAIADAAENQVGVITLIGVPGALGDDTVQRAIQAAVDAGSAVVVADPGADVDLPEDLPVVLVADGPQDDDRAVSGGAPDPVQSTALVAGTAALLEAQGATPGEIGNVLVNTAGGADRTVDAQAAVQQQANVGAGGQQLPPPEDLTGGLSPGTIGIIVFGAAFTAIVATIWVGTRRPRQQS